VKTEDWEEEGPRTESKEKEWVVSLEEAEDLEEERGGELVVLVVLVREAMVWEAIVWEAIAREGFREGVREGVREVVEKGGTEVQGGEKRLGVEGSV